MQPIRRFLGRLIPALLMAASVALLTAGLFAYAPPSPPETADTQTLEPTLEPLEPTLEPLPTIDTGVIPSPAPTALATPTVVTPSPSPTASPSPWPWPTATDQPAPTPPSSPGPQPTPSPTARPPATVEPTPAQGRALATRIVVRSMGIDLPIVRGDDSFPLCNVAQYLRELSQPGQPGTTYVYAHARKGMFLPLLESSRRNDGKGMLGALVEVYTSDHRLHLYEIYKVKRHATDLTLARQLPREGHQLIMQTSEGPRGTVPKLQVAAKPISVVPATAEDARPNPKPRACR